MKFKPVTKEFIKINKALYKLTEGPERRIIVNKLQAPLIRDIWFNVRENSYNVVKVMIEQ